MGITGLLPCLKPVTKSCHISSFRNYRVAVDTYSWLHRSVYSSGDLLLSSSSDSITWIKYCLNALDLLLSYEIDVCLVFDGNQLTAKKETEEIRKEKRQKNQEIGLEMMKNGDKTQGRSYLARSIDITPRMAAQFIQICRQYRPNVKCLVAPYEADAQLAYLSRNHIVDAIISEDSDCIPYLCREVYSPSAPLTLLCSSHTPLCPFLL